MASTSFVSARRLVLAAVFAVFLCLTTALPMKDVVGKAMQNAKSDQQQQQQQHRQKRAVTELVDCPQPTNLPQMFQQINSEVTQTKFLASAIGGKAYGVPTENAKITSGDPNENKTCPNTLTRLDTAPLEHRSLCPYYYDILELPTGYYPSSLKWAKCKCDRCVENGAFGCEPVKTTIVVLKPVGCFQGTQKYEEERIEVSTSCTCALKASAAPSAAVSWAT
ncbi:uncharacterized protein [Littorina saxatilis]|uniref:Uncharacterized protein n=1 Tax=Littorina saxatilis TaxID=31220 RepID=A0AAN9AI56_9CAEN